jgi:Domain of unknown function (DUF4395)
MRLKMSTIFEFGEIMDGYSVRVLNERTVRAAAGILFALGMISFMNAWLIGNFQPTRIFVLAFLIDFAIRIFINPRYAPSLILGQWLVRKQQPEWAGAPQKRFAWAIGFTLALVMAYTMVFNSMVGPINLIVCASCLTLMLFETSFGICIGCKLYNLLSKNTAQLCPGGVCEVPRDAVQGVSRGQTMVVISSILALVGIFQWVGRTGSASFAQTTQAQKPVTANSGAQSDTERCKVPDFAKAIGHEEKWKLHNNC